MIRDREPSLISRHEKWNRDRQRTNGEYTSNSSREVAEITVSMICCVYVVCYLNTFGNKQCISYHVM